MTKVTTSQTEKRKADHIRINQEEDVQFPHLTTGLERYAFKHQALPEIDLQDIDTTLSLFGRKLAYPLLISSMTGGTEQAKELNLMLAAAAQEHKIAMGLGSQRVAIEKKELAHTFQVRQVAPACRRGGYQVAQMNSCPFPTRRNSAAADWFLSV